MEENKKDPPKVTDLLDDNDNDNDNDESTVSKPGSVTFVKNDERISWKVSKRVGVQSVKGLDERIHRKSSAESNMSDAAVAKLKPGTAVAVSKDDGSSVAISRKSFDNCLDNFDSNSSIGVTAVKGIDDKISKKIFKETQEVKIGAVRSTGPDKASSKSQWVEDEVFLSTEEQNKRRQQRQAQAEHQRLLDEEEQRLKQMEQHEEDHYDLKETLQLTKLKEEQTKEATPGAHYVSNHRKSFRNILRVTNASKKTSSAFSKSFRFKKQKSNNSINNNDDHHHHYSNQPAIDAEVQMANPDLIQRSCWQKTDKSNLCVGIGIILFVALAVIIPVSISQADSKKVSTTKHSTPNPTPSPTINDRFHLYGPIQTTIQTYSKSQHLLNEPSHPHSLALDWIVYRDPLNLQPDSDHLYQRWILAVLRYSTSTKDYNDWYVNENTDYMTKDHECDWDLVECMTIEELGLSIPLTEYTLLDSSSTTSATSEKATSSANTVNNNVLPKRIVTKLLLSNMNLQNTIPMDIAELYQLQYLDLSDNHLQGDLPLEFYRLLHLRTLKLQDNQKLTGTIHSNVGNMKKLEVLSLHGNKFHGQLPDSLQHLSNMKKLYLHTNKFTGTILPQMAYMTQLEEVDIANNDFNGTFVDDLGSLTNMKIFDITNNEFEGTVPSEWGNWENLERIHFSFNNLEGQLPASFGNFVNLDWMKLEHCGLEGTIPPELGNLKKVRMLDLSGNNIGGSIPKELGGMESLEYLILFTMRLDGEFPTELGNLSKLKKMQLHFNSFSDVTFPDEVCALREPSGSLTDIWVDCDKKIKCNCCTRCS